MKWDQRVIDILDASFSKVSWENFQETLSSEEISWTVIHGDFHPANMMIQKETKKLLVLDWEMIGIGRGAQDLGQFVISHLSPSDRKDVEKEALDEYYKALTETGVVDTTVYSREVLEKEYVCGGVARWIWLLSYIAQVCPDHLTQYFHDQVLAFCIDHEVTPENVEMPRV